MNSQTVILHIPHASTWIPEEYKADFTGDLSRELQCMTDWYTDELFGFPAVRLVFPVSRLVCDPERFRDDSMEEMARRGMGACYTRGHDGAKIRDLSPDRKEAILRRWYDPHHRSLTKMVSERLNTHGFCTIVDCHSFHAAPLPYEPDQREDRPDICLGTDPFHTPPELIGALWDLFAGKGYSVAVNAPYSGTIVPLPYLWKHSGVRSVMIEVNRGLYLEADGRKSPRFHRVKQDISAAVEKIAALSPFALTKSVRLC